MYMYMCIVCHWTTRCKSTLCACIILTVVIVKMKILTFCRCIIWYIIALSFIYKKKWKISLWGIVYIYTLQNSSIHFKRYLVMASLENFENNRQILFARWRHYTDMILAELDTIERTLSVARATVVLSSVIVLTCIKSLLSFNHCICTFNFLGRLPKVDLII